MTAPIRLQHTEFVLAQDGARAMLRAVYSDGRVNNRAAYDVLGCFPCTHRQFGACTAYLVRSRSNYVRILVDAAGRVAGGMMMMPCDICINTEPEFAIEAARHGGRMFAIEGSARTEDLGSRGPTSTRSRVSFGSDDVPSKSKEP